MGSKERQQLHDEIVDGTIEIEDVSLGKLKDFNTDFEIDYQPTFEFFCRIATEIRRRERQPKRQMKPINMEFYK
jgi:hypothetical protein